MTVSHFQPKSKRPKLRIEEPNFLQLGRSRPKVVKWASFDGTPSSGGMKNTKELLEEIDWVLADEGGPPQKVFKKTSVL